MTPSEIAFLAFGLVIGAALGAALVQVARSRPAPRREVRLTITPNAIPVRRSHTLAVPFDTAHPGMIPGSPDAAAFDEPGAAAAVAWAAGPATGSAAQGGGPTLRTRVSITPVVLPSSAVAVPIAMAAAGTGRDAWADLPALRQASGIGSRTADRVTPAPSL